MRPRTKKFGKRFLSLFLSLAICATLLPTVALAEDAELIKFKKHAHDCAAERHNSCKL